MKYLLIIFLISFCSANAQKKTIAARSSANGTPDTVYTNISDIRQVTRSLIDSLDNNHVFAIIKNAFDTTANKGAIPANKSKDVAKGNGRTIIKPFRPSRPASNKNADSVKLINTIVLAPGVTLGFSDTTITLYKKR